MSACASFNEEFERPVLADTGQLKPRIYTAHSASCARIPTTEPS